MPSALNMAWWSQCIRDMRPPSSPPYTLTLNTSSSWNARAKGENLTACERWPKFLRSYCSYCTYLSRSVFSILSQSQNINSHLHTQYCKLRLPTSESIISVVTFKVKQQSYSLKNNEGWQSEQRTVRGRFQSPWHWLSVWRLSYSIITLFISAKGYVWRDTLRNTIQRLVQTRGETEIFSCLIVSKLQLKNQ